MSADLAGLARSDRSTCDKACLGLSDEIEATRNADKILSADRAIGELQGLSQTGCHLAHLAAMLAEHISQILR